MVRPTDYARVVKKISNEIHSSHVYLVRILPLITVMVVLEMASTEIGKPFPKEVFQKTINAYDRILALDVAKKKIITCEESIIPNIAPNLLEIVGSVAATRLIVIASGLCAVSKKSTFMFFHL